ncbi:MAG: AI-2E family transporter [Chthoniobacterales bacterium]
MTKPSHFQYRMWWAALTAVAFGIIGASITGVGWLAAQLIGFLQPVLLPLAVAGILTYLLDPVVTWLAARGVRRTLGVVIVFAAFLLVVAGITLWIVPSIHRQGVTFAESLPEYTHRAQALLTKTTDNIKEWSELHLLKKDPAQEEINDVFQGYVITGIRDGTEWLKQKLPDLAIGAGNWILRGIGGAFGVFGLLISMVLVPIFLFFFLKEGPKISSSWSNYLPLRASPLKSEIVSLLSEINSYLISFFRGQLVVSMIDGFLIAVALLIMGMDFAVLIGLMVGVLGLIPYAGVIICWIPAVIIAIAQWGDWTHPIIVTAIFLVVNNLDGIVIAPRIVGESVGLHPLTVIVSVLVWSIVLGGLLGALLAVPLTATLKVLLKRYFWDKPSTQAVMIEPSG